MIESFEWIQKAIKTSVSQFHIDGCVILIDLFKNKYLGEGDFYKYYGELMNDLITKETFLCVEV